MLQNPFTVHIRRRRRPNGNGAVGTAETVPEEREVDVFSIDRMPDCLTAALPALGIDGARLELACFADRDRDGRPAEVWLLASRESLWVLSGTERGGSEQRTWENQTLEQYPLTGVRHFVVEERRSTAVLLADREGETVLFASFTNSCLPSVRLFVRYIGRLEVSKPDEPLEIDPEDLPDARFCPICGMRYPDPHRRLCPRCVKKGQLFRRTWQFFSPYRGQLLLLLGSLILLTGTGILAPYLSSGFFFDEVIDTDGKFAGALLLVLFLVVATKLIRTFATMLNNWLSSKVAAEMTYSLKKTIFTAIERLSLGFFTGRQTGGLMTQVNDDSNTIYEFFCDGVPYLIVNLVQVAVLVVLLLTIQPLLAVLALLPVPVFFLLMRVMFRNERKLHARRFSGSSRLSAFLADVLSGMRVVKAFSQEGSEIRRFSGYSQALADSDRHLRVFHTCVGTVAGAVLFLGNIIAWGAGGWMVISGYGGMTYGRLLTVIAYMNMIYSPLFFFSDMMNRSADCTNALRRLYEIMDAEPDVREKPGALAPETLDGRVEFDHVSFSYNKGRRIIDDVSFTVPSGGVLGIVGHTGAGKSTLANLLMRLYDTEEGEIRIGGIPVKDLSFETVYRNIAIVSQETYLFMGTILDNIRYARPDATHEEVIEAARLAGAHDFIVNLPDGYHTRVGFGFTELSGGERQRVSVARAILKNPKILILDEATAAMDTATERRIQDALSRLIVGKTTIMIAHRLSTLRDADRLIVIEHGRVAESGTHRELLAKPDGVYHRLYTLQLQALRSAGIAE